ncbi:MAG: GNAT family N-acetyltransferase [Alphaproteobacteria bacterium]|nr:GNAT family N-acetyltransferase [Alphaproteobacteria bacterium]
MPATAASVVFPATNTSVTIRKANTDDCEAMLRMVHALAEYQGVDNRVSASAAELRRAGFGATPQFEALIAERFGAPVGLAMFQTNYSIWEGASSLQITDLFVDEAVRGTGVGFHLVQEVARIARDRGCKGLQLNMVHANPSRSSLDRIGFVHQDDLLHYRLDAPALKKLVEMER